MSSKHIDLGSNPNNETIRKSHSGKYKRVATSFVTCTNGEVDYYIGYVKSYIDNGTTCT